jgi:hypothetical protein
MQQIGEDSVGAEASTSRSGFVIEGYLVTGSKYMAIIR